MKITKAQLKQIIKEELKFLNESKINLTSNEYCLERIIKEETGFCLLEKKNELISEIFGRKKAAKEAIDDASTTTDEIEEQLKDTFNDPTAAANAVFLNLEKYVGMRGEMWYDEAGNMKKDIKQKLKTLFKDMRGMREEMKKAVGASIPIEKKLEAISSLSKFGAAGTFLFGLYEAFTSFQIVAPTLMPFSLGAISIGTLAPAIFQASFILAAGALGTLVLSKLIRASKEGYMSLRAGHEIFAPLLRTAISFGKSILSVVRWFVEKALGLVGAIAHGGQAALQSTHDEKEEELPASLREVKFLQEIVSFVEFFNKQKLIYA